MVLDMTIYPVTDFPATMRSRHPKRMFIMGEVLYGCSSDRLSQEGF